MEKPWLSFLSRDPNKMDQRIIPVGGPPVTHKVRIFAPCKLDNFDIVRYEKSPERFDIWLDEKKVLLPEDRANFGRNLPFSPHSHLVLL